MAVNVLSLLLGSAALLLVSLRSSQFTALQTPQQVRLGPRVHVGGVCV